MYIIQPSAYVRSEVELRINDHMGSTIMYMCIEESYAHLHAHTIYIYTSYQDYSIHNKKLCTVDFTILIFTISMPSHAKQEELELEQFGICFPFPLTHFQKRV